MTTPIPEVLCPLCGEGIELTEELLRQWYEEIKAQGGEGYFKTLLGQHASPRHTASTKLRELAQRIRSQI